MNSERLQWVLENLQKNNDRFFSMTEWHHCAIGLCNRDSRFRQEGMTFGLGNKMPIYNRKAAMVALAEFFDLSLAETMALFSARNDSRTREDQAKAIKAVLQGEWPEMSKATVQGINSEIMEYNTSHGLLEKLIPFPLPSIAAQVQQLKDQLVEDNATPEVRAQQVLEGVS